jgi:hypothetical protein
MSLAYRLDRHNFPMDILLICGRPTGSAESFGAHREEVSDSLIGHCFAIPEESFLSWQPPSNCRCGIDQQALRSKSQAVYEVQL